MTRVTRELAHFVNKAHVTDARSDIGQLPWLHARAILSNSIDLAAIQLDNALVAAANVEDVGETAVLLFEGHESIAVNRFARSGRPDDEHDSNSVNINVLKERRPCPGLEDVQVFVIEILRTRVGSAPPMSST